MTIPMKRGARDPQTSAPSVHDVQKSLNSRLSLNLTIDGIFGLSTERAVKTFQSRNALSITGVVNSATWLKLSVVTIPVVTAPAPTTSAGLRIGAWTYGMTTDPSKLTALETLLGRKMNVASYFYGYGDWWPVGLEKTLSASGTRDVLLSWDMGPYRYASWTAGEHDAYLNTIVACAKSYPYKVYVRPWPEMNGDWQDFQPDATGSKRYGGTYAEFITAWRYLVDYFRKNNVFNIKWVFNPTTDVYAGTTDVHNIYPGSDYVDVLGLDGYNWGNGSPFVWQEFKTIFSSQYARLTALNPTAPVWVCETGCKEPTVNDGAPIDVSHSKGSWVAGMFRDIPIYFPRIDTVCWFNETKERHWTVNSSTDSLTAIKAHLAS